MENLDKLILELIKYPNETEWFEFKHENYTPDTIGEDISALANGATLAEKPFAYFIWGVHDKTHELVGTEHDLQNLKKGNQELENWLRSLLSKNADFEYQLVSVNGASIGVMKIHAAMGQPVTFEKNGYVRVGSYTKKLADYPAIQARLWNRLTNVHFEDQIAKGGLALSEALNLLDHSIYFDILGIPQPSNHEAIAHYLLEDSILVKQDDGLFAITNMGAVLLAKRITNFPTISRKAIRVVQYQGASRMNMLKEDVGNKGYVSGFEGLMRFIGALIPTQEVITGALREKKAAYPEIAIREAVANALIHQDLSVTGTGPIVEVFDNRIEITNSGTPLVDIMRIIDNPPKSRNEKLASMMRRLRMCEELGTGWDKIILACELAQLPAPRISLYEDSMKVILFSEIPFSSLSTDDKLWSCYIHACIQFIQGEYMTNATLRQRFGLPDTASASISRLIKDAVDKGLIKLLDPETSNKYRKYIPLWA